MPSDSRGAANFFGDSPQESEDLQRALDAKEGLFEGRAVRQLLRFFAIDPKHWDVKDKLGDRFRFPVFDEAYPRFPVRLGTSRAAAKRRRAKRRKVLDLAFHELMPIRLFKEFKSTQVYNDWEVLKEDQSVDGRSVGLVFLCVGTLFVCHDWNQWSRSPTTAAPHFVTGGLIVEQFDDFLAHVRFTGWRPD